MKKENKELLKTIISNQELMMKALNISVPEKRSELKDEAKIAAKNTATKKAATKAPSKKAPAKKTTGK